MDVQDPPAASTLSATTVTEVTSESAPTVEVPVAEAVAKAAAEVTAAVVEAVTTDNVDESSTTASIAGKEAPAKVIESPSADATPTPETDAAAAAADATVASDAATTTVESIAEAQSVAEAPTNGPPSAAEATTEKRTAEAPEINNVDSSDKSEDGVPTPPDVVEVVSSDLSSDSSSEVPPQKSAKQAAPKPTAAAAASSLVIEVTDSDSLDDDIDNMIVTETVGEDEPPQDDELMREMEEIEGTLDSAKTAAAVETTAEAAAEQSTKPTAGDETPVSSAEATATSSKPADAGETASTEQETSDLLKDLESGGDSAESISSAAAVDSTSEEKTQKRPHSAVESGESSEAAVPGPDAKKAATAAEVAVQPAASDAPMDVDDDIDETTTAAAAAAVSTDKDEGISSTSAEVSSNTGAASQADNSAVSSTDGAAPEPAKPQSESTAGNAEAEAATDDLDASVANATAASDSAADRSLITPVPSSAAGGATLASDNKLLANLMLNNGNSSTPNSNPVSAAATPNVFNSTPIQRQFEISSENVSKIDGGIDSQNTSTTAGTLTTSTSSASSPSVAGAAAAAAEPQSSSDNLTHYAKVLKQFNGLGADLTIARASTTTTTTTSAAAAVSAADTKAAAPQQPEEEATHNGSCDDTTSSSSTTGHHQQAADSESFSYDVSIWYDQSELVYLNVERKSPNSSTTTTGASTTTATTDSTTNGSVTSVGPFTLPGQTAAAAVAAANSAQHSSIASSSSIGGGGGSGDSTRLASATLPSQVPRVRQTVAGGSVGLANFMIEHFTALKRELGVVEEVAPATAAVAAGRGGKAAQKKAAAAAVKAAAASASPDVTASSASSRRNKRAAVEVDADAAEPIAKKAKSTPNVEIALALATAESRISVLARWADKKYYAGRLKESKPNSKYVVIFEDGATKTLVQEHIVFGNDSGILPLINQYVHARIDGDEDTYEPGLVTEINSTAGDTILYTVVAESQTVTVTSSDLYLEEDQARLIQQSTEANVPPADAAVPGSADAAAAALRSPGTPTVGSKRSSRPTAKFGEAASPRSRTSTGGKTTAAADGAEPSTSAAAAAAASAAGTRQTGRRNKSKAQAAADFEAAAFAAHPMIRSFSDSSELSDTLDSTEMQVSQAEMSALEEVDGVQPELQKTARDSELCKLSFQHEYLGNGDRTRSMDELLGPIPAAAASASSDQLFHNKYFMLTCTIPAAKKLQQNGVGAAAAAAQAPFFKDHLRRQIEAGGGVVYEHFEDVPKAKYRFVRLVAAQPCATAKYVQCLAANIKVVSHRYIIECCRQRTLLDYRRYLLPAGWSLMRDRLIRYQTGRAADQRHSANPLSKAHILIASDNRDFEAFWSRVCTLATASVKLVATPADITAATRGYMLTDNDFSAEVKAKAEHFKVPVVSTVWLVECLVAGELCAPDANEKFRKAYQDEYF